MDRHLGDGLEAEHAATTELAQARERVLESVDGAERIEFVDDEPEALVALPSGHGLEDREAQPRGDDRAQRCDLVGLVGQEQHSPALSAPSRAR